VAATGDEAWSYDTTTDGAEAEFHGDALVTGDAVVIGTDGPPVGWLYAFERANGRTRWKHSFARGVSAQVLGRDDLVYAVGGAGEVAALDVRTGAVAWHFADEQPGEQSWARHDPVLAGDLLLVPWPDGVILALDARSGEPRWRAALGAQVTTSVTAIGDSAWIGTIDGKLRKLATGSGAVLATVDAGGRPYGDLQVGGDCLLVLSVSQQHAISCHQPASGSVRWRHPVGAEISTFRSLVEGEVVVAGHEKRELFALSLVDGEERWRCAVGGVPRGLSSGGPHLFVGMLNGTVIALPVASCREGA
jgi:outer membrane protein assembly factor BamB